MSAEEASFAAILGATVPLFAAALGARLLDERLGASRIGGLVMGVVGSNAKVSNGMVGAHGHVADGAELRDAGVPDSPPE